MHINKSQKLSVDDQKSVLICEMNNQLKSAGWLGSNGIIKKQIKFRVRNITIDNIRFNTTKWAKNNNILLLVLEYDANYKTEKEEATKHLITYWSLYAVEDDFNIYKMSEWLNKQAKEVKSQLVFTEKIDMNLYNYYEMDKKGWKIIKKIEK